MFKYLSLSILILLQGCQLQQLALEGSANRDSCLIDEEQLFALQTIELKFLEKADHRSRIMQNAIRSKDRPLLALLLSTPYSSTEQLQQSKRHFSKLVLYPHVDCPGDRYLDTRNRFASALLWMRAEQDNLLTENRNLQIKIDALTQIETDLEKQREVQE